MPRTVVIRIVIDNRDALNAAKAQREAAKALREEIAFGNAEMRKAESHAKDMAAGFDQSAKSTESLAVSFTKGFLAARAMSAAFSTITSSISFLITETAGLELTFAKVKAVTGDSQEEIQHLSDVVFGLGRVTAASNSDIGRAALELAKLGFAGKDLEIALAGVARLSSILGDSLETTGNLVGGVIQTFDLSAEEAAKVADKLFIATGQSATNIEGFRIAFALAGNVAHDAGITFDQLAAAIAALSNQGIRASTIGTGLRNFIANLSMEGSKAQKALGGSIEDMGLLGAMEKLSSLHLKPGSLIELFGKPGAPVASGLSHAREEFLKFTDAIEASNGALDKGHKIIDDTLIGSITLLKNSLVELFSVGTSGAAPILVEIFQGIAKDIQAITDGVREFNTIMGILKGGEDAMNSKYHVGESRVVGGRIVGPNIDDLKKRLQGIKEAEAADIRNTDEVYNNLFGKAVAPVKADKLKEKAFDLDAAMAKFEKIKIDFEWFKSGKGEFNFDENEKALSGLADQLDKIGHRKEALQVLRELITLQNEEAKAAKYRQDFNAAIDTTVANIGKDLEKQDPSKSPLAKPLPDKDKDFAKFIKDSQADLDSFNQKIELTKVGMDGLGQAIDITAQLIADNLVEAFTDGEYSMDNFMKAFESLAKNFVAQIIAMEIRIAAFKLALKIAGAVAGGVAGGPSGAAAGAYGGAAAGAALDAGATGVTDLPSIGALSKTGVGDTGRVTTSGMSKTNAPAVTNIYVAGDIFNAEKLVDKMAQTNEKSKARYV